MYDVKKGKMVSVSPAEAAQAVVSFRDQYTEKKGKLHPRSRNVKASAKGKISVVPAKDVDYVIPSAQAMYGVASNMIPFLQNDQGNRTMTAGKMMTQALPLVSRESPLVRVVAGKDATFETISGQAFSHKSPVSGTVMKVTEDEVQVKDSKGKKHTINLYRDFPLNSKTAFLDSETKVKKGDKVKKGQIVADTNFTKDGDLALGVNANIAYVPYKGYNFEDGVVISESFSKKLTSSHLYKMTVSLDKITMMNLSKFKAYYPDALDMASASKMDEDGVVKKGETVKFGDILMAVLRKEEKGPEDLIIGRLHKAFIKPYKNKSVTWDEEDEGTVVDVVKTARKIEVHVRTAEPAKIGDKLAGRHGNKGTITAIIADNEMLTSKNGETVEVVMNPHSVPSRINPGQILETVAGKVARKEGRPFDVRNFGARDYLADVKKAAKKAGVQDKEDLLDPVTNQRIPGVLVGQQYMLKLDHPTRKKFSARAQGGYTADLQPSRGKHEGGQSMDTLTLYSMLSHGALHNLREMATYKSERNDEVWRALQLGQSLPAPQVPFATEKFISMVKGLGVDVRKDGNTLALAPMTDKKVLEYSSGAIQNSKVIRGKDLRPEKGGLFDPVITGGIAGDKWNHIELAEAMPNPIFENAIKSILGVTQAIYDDIIAGRRYVSKTGQIVTEETDDTVTGGEGILKLLSKIDVEKEIKKLKVSAGKKKGPALDKINKTIRYLRALKKNNLKPKDYMVTNVPVLPARLRPIYPLPDGSLNVTEVNHLYKDLIDLRDQSRDFETLGMPESEMATLRENTYKGMKALAGLQDHLGGR
jgi:DNA-directed RNA polymerase beta subunit